jgi:CheY-like chemotaxis protein
MTQAGGLIGCRVFVVEDEALLSMLLQQLLGEIGCIVAGSASRLAEAMRQAETLIFDVALLDINLHGERVFPLAEAILARSQGVVIVSGYSDRVLPESLRAVPLLQKPYLRHDLARVLCTVRCPDNIAPCSSQL